MLQDKDRIFTNLYGDSGRDIKSAKARGDWKDTKEIIAGMSRLKGARRKPTSIALEEDLLAELKKVAGKKGVPYQVLMRLLISDGLKRIKAAS